MLYKYNGVNKMKNKFVEKVELGMLNFNEGLVEKYKDKLEILERAINENWSINRLIDEFDGEFAVNLGGNSSGIDVAKLDTMEVDSWTW